MNKDTAKGDWKQLSGAIKHSWGRLTDDDLLRAKGDGEYLVGKLQEYYGLSKEKAKQGLRELGYLVRGAERRDQERRGRDDDDAPTERASDRL
jgi:uncharacterized protein YjbJ (UPF0337 family)